MAPVAGIGFRYQMKSQFGQRSLSLESATFKTRLEAHHGQKV